MARIRSIHPDACESEKLLQLSDGAERTLWRLTTHTDDAGRGVDNPKLLASKLYPLDDTKDAEVLDAHLWELVGVGMLKRYEVGGKRYYQVHDFEDWQKPRHKTETKLPAPTEQCATDVGHTSDIRPDPPHGVVVGDGVVVGGGAGDEPPNPRTNRKTRLPESWSPNAAHAKKASDAGIDCEHEADQFKNHHGAKGSTFADWDKAFHTWLGNAAKWARDRNKGQDPSVDISDWSNRI